MMRLVILALGTVLALPALAQQQSVPYPEPPGDGQVKKPVRILTPEEKAEKAQRLACKIQLCSIFSSKDPEGADIDCPIVKTWREDDIEEILGGNFDWPWGKARCSTQLKLSRRALATAAGESKVDIVMEPHTISCSLDLKSEGGTYDVKVDIAPEVKFENGKAVAAKMNWGDVSAPMLANALIYPGTALDNSVNALGGEIVKMTNEFMGKKCSEVKDQLPMRTNFTPAPR